MRRNLSRSFWETQENQRNFLDMISRRYHISHPTQWKRVPLTLIRSKGGKVPIIS